MNLKEVGDVITDRDLVERLRNGNVCHNTKYVEKVWHNPKDMKKFKREAKNCVNLGAIYAVAETPDIELFYDLKGGIKLGEGAFGAVLTCKRIEDKKSFVVKKIIKSAGGKKEERQDEFHSLRSEAEVMYFCKDHHQTCHLEEVFENKTCIWFVMEHLSGGTLNERVKMAKKSKKRIPAIRAKSWFHQMMAGLCFIHSQGVVHCDIKPDNFAFENSAMDSRIKLIDFGFAQVYSWNSRLTQVCGTPHYMAPEVARGKYGSAADIWSMGCCLFFMSFHFNPFYTKKMSIGELIAHVQKGFKPEVKNGWGNWFPKKMKSDADLRDIITLCLKMEVRDRPTSEEVLDHRWFKELFKDEQRLSINVIKSVLRIPHTQPLQKLILAALIRQDFLTNDEIVDVSSTFKAIDLNGNGRISLDEFKAAAHAAGNLSDAEIEESFNNLDLEKHHQLEIKEFFLARVWMKVSLRRERLKSLFDDIKHDKKNQHIEVKHIITMLKKFDMKVPKQFVEEFVEMIDPDKKIHWKQFTKLFHYDP